MSPFDPLDPNTLLYWCQALCTLLYRDFIHVSICTQQKRGGRYSLRAPEPLAAPLPLCAIKLFMSCLYQCQRRPVNPIPARMEALALKGRVASAVLVLMDTLGSSVNPVKPPLSLQTADIDLLQKAQKLKLLLRFTWNFLHTHPSCVAPSDCYVNNGVTYRGVASVTEEGQECLDWHSYFILSRGEDPFTMYSDFTGLEYNNHCRYSQIIFSLSVIYMLYTFFFYFKCSFYLIIASRLQKKMWVLWIELHL